MQKQIWIVGALIIGAALVGCASSETPASVPVATESAKTAKTSEMLTVQGRVSSRVTSTKARAVAIASDGRMFWAHLDAQGDFTLKLPVGLSYRIVIANERAGGKGQEVVGRLSLAGKNGKTEWLVAKQSGTVDFGTVKPSANANGLGVQCMGCGADDDDDDDDDDSDDHDDDDDCHEDKGGAGKTTGYPADGGGAGTGHADDDDDDDDSCHLCAAAPATSLEPTKAPGAEMCGDDDDDDDDDDDTKACQ